MNAGDPAHVVTTTLGAARGNGGRRYHRYPVFQCLHCERTESVPLNPDDIESAYRAFALAHADCAKPAEGA